VSEKSFTALCHAYAGEAATTAIIAQAAAILGLIFHLSLGCMLRSGMADLKA
jgi:hypothetical protein